MSLNPSLTFMGLVAPLDCDSHCNHESFCGSEAGSMRYERLPYSSCNDMASGARPAFSGYGFYSDFHTSVFHSAVASLDSRRRYR